MLAPTRELALQVCEAFEKYAAHAQGRARAARLRRPGLRRPAVGAAPRRPRRRRHPGPDHGPPGEGHARPLRAEVPGARRGRRDAQHGLRRRRRDDPRGHPGRPSRSRCSPRPCRPRSAGSRSSYLHDPDEITVKNKTTTSANTTQRYLIVSYPQKVDALTRILEVENFEGMIVFVRTKNETETLAEKLRARGFSAPAINGDVAQVAARAHRQPAQGRQARHPGRHRRRRPRPRRRADQPRRQLRHPDRHRVLRAPDRPHRPRRPQRRRDLLRHPARALPAQAHREGHPPAADRDAAAERRGRQRHPAGPLRRPDHRGAEPDRADRAVPRHRRPLRAQPRRARG